MILFPFLPLFYIHEFLSEKFNKFIFKLKKRRVYFILIRIVEFIDAKTTLISRVLSIHTMIRYDANDIFS